jgi:hypothetical protein
LVEHDLFGDAGPSTKISRSSGRFERLAAEEDARRLRDDLLPALDRATRTIITAIRTLREFRAVGVNVTTGNATQVNVADTQVRSGRPSHPRSPRRPPDFDVERAAAVEVRQDEGRQV